MKRMICLFLTACMVFGLAACGTGTPAEPVIKDWSRQGYYSNENGNILSVTWMEDLGDPGWYVGAVIGEDPVEDSYGGILPQEGSSLHGSLPSAGSSPEITVTVSEEGEDGLQLIVDGGETYHFSPMNLPEATIVVNINTDGLGMIAYAEGEDVPEMDPEYPFQSAYIGLAEPAVHTFAARPHAGYLFVKWTKNGEDFSTEPQITLLLDESADYVAVFEEDPDWQNPVMNFVGEYQCGQARAAVECFGYDEAWITVESGDRSQEVTRWYIVDRLDTDTLTINYSGSSKANVVYDADGEVKSEDPVYDDGTGTITFSEDGFFTWHEDQSESGEDMVFEWTGSSDGPFEYIHDPQENPGAMEDIIRNPDAVYGFSPDPDSTRLGSFAEYDWTDPEFVARAQEERRAYHESMSSMMDILYRMRAEGASTEEMARAVSTERNRLRLAAYGDDSEGLAAAKESNLKTYGHEDGPTPDELFEKYGSWTVVLQKSFSTNMGMDACCGLYDEYYWLYIELGYVE